MRLKTFIVNMKSMMEPGDDFSCSIRYSGKNSNCIVWLVEYSGKKIKDEFGEWHRSFYDDTPEALLRQMASVLGKAEGNFLTFDDSDL